MSNEADTRSNDLTSVVKEAFDSISASMRTVGGIVRDTGLAEHTVRQILESHPDIFVKSQTIAPGGSAVYVLGK